MKGRLGIVAGSGPLPRLLVKACRSQGRGVFVLALEGYTEAASVADVEHRWVRLGAFKPAFQALHDAGAEEVVLAGPVKRPGWHELRPDSYGLRFLTKAGFRSLGDDGLLRAIIRGIEDEGFRVVGADDILADLLVREGAYGNLNPDAQAQEDIARGIAVVRALGEADVGQAAVVQQGLVLGVEAIEGTDELMKRCASLHREGPGGVLVKIRKPQQERRADLPTIGPGTVETAADSGLRGIAVEAASCLVINPAAVAEAANQRGLFVVGIRLQPS
jgi:DUF1009 family protein